METHIVCLLSALLSSETLERCLDCEGTQVTNYHSHSQKGCYEVGLIGGSGSWAYDIAVYV